MDGETPRKRYVRILQEMKNERTTWLPHWEDLARYMKPRSYRYLEKSRNKGTKQNFAIINNTATKALRTTAAGMMAGITSPARPWFRLGVRDPALSRNNAVRQWLDEAEEALRRVFAGSNIYKCLHSTYEQLALFGTACFVVEEDRQDVLRGYVFPIGQYCLANSARLQVDTCFREYGMTLAQVVERFGVEACSPQLQEAYQQGKLTQWVDVVHVVEPNRDYVKGKLGPKGKQWKSCWFEANGDESTGFLSESGYDSFPIMAPRWQATGEDVYGESPGMEALGDVRALQELEKAKGKLVQKIVDPPMKGPSSLQNQVTSLLPGAVTYVDSVGQGNTFSPVFEVNPAAVSTVETSCREHEFRINAALYAELWMLIAQGQNDPQKTATEVSALQQEKMQQLGPVMENLERELLGPLIDRCFSLVLRAGVLEQPPQELQGQKLAVEYISIMAQAQRMLGLTAKERMLSFLETAAQVKPDVVDKVDFDLMVEDAAQDLGLNANLIVGEDDVQAIRQQRAQAQAQQAQAEQAPAMAGAAKSLSETDTEGDNALTHLMGGVAAAQQGGALK